MERNFDLVILGSGSTAVAAAHKARHRGVSVVMVEKDLVGGTCLNVGCVPSKFMIEAARRHFLAQSPKQNGLHGSRAQADFAKLVVEKDEIVEQYRKEKIDSFKPDGIELIKGHASFLDNRNIKVGEHVLTASNILIATGSEPLLPHISGLPTVDYITSDLLATEGNNRLDNVPETLAIIGGGYIALELGQMFSRFGSKVTIFEPSDRILKNGFDAKVGEVMAECLIKEGIEIKFNLKIDQVSRKGEKTIVHTSDGNTRSFDKLLLATGRAPRTSTLNIESSGVKLTDAGAVQVDKHLATNVETIYAAGDVIGSEHRNEMATPVGVQDGFIAVHNMYADPFTKLSVNHRVIPRAVFTDPEVAAVGVSESDAAHAEIETVCETIPMRYTPRAVIIKEESGFAKIVADKRTKEVLGVTVVGHSASEIINIAAMAMRFHAKLEDFVEMIYVYPTMSECLRFVAHRANSKFQ